MNQFNHEPLVSVIIPTYNCDRYIVEAIESVLNQTYSNKEIIVVDDGSTDNTSKVIKPYLDRIRYLVEENQGASVARNLGIEQAHGEFIAFLDADDFFIDRHKLTEQIACFSARPTSGVVHSGWQRVDRDGNKIVDREPWLATPNLDLAAWLIYNPIRPSAMMFRQQWLHKIGGFDPQYRVSEDTDLMLRLALAGCEITWLKKVTTAYRQHDRSLTIQTLEISESLLQMLDDFFSLPGLSDPILQLKDTVYHSKYIWLAWRFYAAGDFKQMAEYLDKSLAYSPAPLTSNATIWLQSFDSMSKEEGRQFSSSTLIRSPEWQQLIKNVLIKIAKQRVGLASAKANGTSTANKN